MVYYPSPKNMDKKVEKLKKEEKQNLNIIENSIKLKLNSMRINIENETNNNNSFDNYFYSKMINLNNSNNSIISNQNSKGSINKSQKSLNAKHNKKNYNNNTCKRSNNSLFNIHKNSSINSNSDNTNHQSSNVDNKQKKISKFKSEVLNNSFNKPHFEKININKAYLKLTNVGNNKKNNKNRLISSKYIKMNNEIK